MKKLILTLLVVTLTALLFGCSPQSSTDSTEATVGNGISWSKNTVDKMLVGTWQIEGDENNIYYIFDEDGTICMARGRTYYEGEVTYGIDTEGNHKYFSDFNYWAGEFTYVVEGDKAIFVDDDGVTLTLIKAEYTQPELKQYEDFSAENPLLGTWYNDEYCDSYSFNSDGTAVYELTDSENACVIRVEYTYTEEDGYIYFTSHDGTEMVSYSESYKLADDTLDIYSSGKYIRQ